MNAVDRYVIYDDVNFIKGGWIHRNRILLGGEAKYINVPMLGASSFKKINEIMVHHEIALENKNLRMLENAYGKAPYFQEIFPILERIIRNPEESLALYLADSIREIHDYLEMKSELVLSSDLKRTVANVDRKRYWKFVSCCRQIPIIMQLVVRHFILFLILKRMGLRLNF